MAYLFVHFVDKVIFNGHVESEDEGDNDNNYMKDVRKKFNNSLKIDMNCVTHYGKPHEEQNLLNEPLSEHCSTDQKCKNQICPDNEIHEETFKALVRNKIMVLTNSTFKKKKQNATRPAEKIALENGDGDYQGDYIKMGSEPNSQNSPIQIGNNDYDIADGFICKSLTDQYVYDANGQMKDRVLETITENNVSFKKNTNITNIDQEKKETSEEEQKFQFTPYLLVMAMGIHATFAGLALGLQPDMPEFLGFLFAILAHKWAEAMTIGISFAKANTDFKQSMIMITISAFATPIGTIAG